MLLLVSSAYMPSPLPRQVQWSLFARLSPLPAAFPCNSEVGSCNCCFEACSAFTHVMACTLAESPCDPLHRKLRQVCCLRRRFDCYRVERTSSRAGVAPAEVQRLSRRTVSPVRSQIHCNRNANVLATVSTMKMIIIQPQKAQKAISIGVQVLDFILDLVF